MCPRSGCEAFFEGIFSNILENESVILDIAMDGFRSLCVNGLVAMLRMTLIQWSSLLFDTLLLTS